MIICLNFLDVRFSLMWGHFGHLKSSEIIYQITKTFFKLIYEINKPYKLFGHLSYSPYSIPESDCILSNLVLKCIIINSIVDKIWSTVVNIT